MKLPIVPFAIAILIFGACSGGGKEKQTNTKDMMPPRNPYEQLVIEDSPINRSTSMQAWKNYESVANETDPVVLEPEEIPEGIPRVGIHYPMVEAVFSRYRQSIKLVLQQRDTGWTAYLASHQDGKLIEVYHLAGIGVEGTLREVSEAVLMPKAIAKAKDYFVQIYNPKRSNYIIEVSPSGKFRARAYSGMP